MIPMPYGTVTVSQEEITIQICPDDADLLTVPPMRFKRSPIGFAEETRDKHCPVTMPQGSMQEEPRMRSFDWVWSQDVFVHEIEG
jgi:hypothetical protein